MTTQQQHEIEAFKTTLEIARRTWDNASIKAIRSAKAEDEMEARAAFHWMRVARENLNTAERAVR